MSNRNLPKATEKTTQLCKALGCTQTELLNVMVYRFGNILPAIIKADNYNYVTKWSIRKWLENNGGEDNRRSAGTGLKAMRERAGIKQSELAEMVGCSRSLIAKIETGKCADPGKLEAIRAILTRAK